MQKCKHGMMSGDCAECSGSDPVASPLGEQREELEKEWLAQQEILAYPNWLQVQVLTLRERNRELEAELATEKAQCDSEHDRAIAAESRLREMEQAIQNVSIQERAEKHRKQIYDWWKKAKADFGQASWQAIVRESLISCLVEQQAEILNALPSTPTEGAPDAQRFTEAELKEHAIQLGAIGMGGSSRRVSLNSRLMSMYIEEHFQPKARRSS